MTEARRAKRRAERETQAPTSTNRKEARRERAAKRAETADLRKSVRDHEKRMEKLTTEREKLEARLADPEVYEGSTAKLMDLQVRHSDIKAQLAATEETWLELSERLEAAE